MHEGVEVDEVITCVECGGRAHLLSHPQPDVGFSPGDAVVYRCSDCLDRFDVILPELDDRADEHGA